MTKLVLVGEAYGEMEAALSFPFVGPAGFELLSLLEDSELLTLTDADRADLRNRWNSSGVLAAHYMRSIWERHPEVILTNVFNLRPTDNDISALCTSKTGDHAGLPAIRTGKYLRREYLPEVERLYSELKAHAPNLIIALGATAAWALLHNSGISRIRGTVTLSPATNLKVLPVYHPAAILRQYELRAVTVLDLQKAKFEATFRDIRRPARKVYIEPTLSDLDWFFDYHIRKAKFIAPDIETVSRQISCIGFATDKETSIVVPFIDLRTESGSYWPTLEEELGAWRWVKKVLALPQPKILQNALFDMNFLWKGYGIPTLGLVEDTMLLHHSLQPESLKGLGFLGSVYCNEASWKLLGRQSKTIKRDA